MVEHWCSTTVGHQCSNSLFVEICQRCGHCINSKPQPQSDQMGCSEKVVRRLHDPPHWLNMQRFAWLTLIGMYQVINPSTSEWSNPIVLLMKKDGSIRFCIVFQRINAQSSLVHYPMPRLVDLIETVGPAKFITTLDLCKGYW